MFICENNGAKIFVMEREAMTKKMIVQKVVNVDKQGVNKMQTTFCY
jgi:hypothetical protein